MTELKGPGSAEIKNFIKEKYVVEFCLVNDKKLSGQILWHDENAFHIQAEDGRILTILKRAVIYYSKLR